jgi:hypothetical protein
MVKISLDEAFVFDMLAIMDVKIQKMPVENTLHLRQKLFQELCEQIGHGLVLEVIESEEYLFLIETNSKTFDLVDKARNGNGLAKETDDANMLRHHYKKEIQKKFFNSILMEEKQKV